MTKKQENKPIIETILNTAALAIIAGGTSMVLSRDYYGFLLIMFGAALEFFKYWGRKEAFW